MAEKILRVVTVLFKKRPNEETLFLIMHRCLNWKGWELPKGQIEPSESLEEAAKREVFEETGLKKIRVVKQVSQKMGFFDKVRKKQSEVFGFLVEALDDQAVSLAGNPIKEHDGFEWVSASEVQKRLKFENTRAFFKKALEELKEFS